MYAERYIPGGFAMLEASIYNCIFCPAVTLQETPNGIFPFLVSSTTVVECQFNWR